MNLKESYQYQNHLASMFETTCNNLSLDQYITRTQRTHCRSKVSEGAQDDVVDETVERPFGDISVDAVISFAAALIDEQICIGSAITDAKHSAKIAIFNDLSIDIDAELSGNKSRHRLIAIYDRMAKIKPAALRKAVGQDYKFNAEGNQTPFVYPVEDRINIDFNRGDLCCKLKELKEKACNISMKAEKAMLNTEIRYDPKFDINDSYMDTLAAFAIENGFA